jgi:hypothetical protein
VKRIARTALLTALGAAVAVVAVGASAVRGQPSHHPAETSDASAASVTEYTQAIVGYVGCLEQASHSVVVQRSADRLMYEYEIPAAAVHDGSDDRCYSEHLYRSDVARQFAIDRLRRAAFDRDRAAVLDCASKLGVELSRDAAYDELLRGLGDRGSDVAVCAHPDPTSIGRVAAVAVDVRVPSSG